MAKKRYEYSTPSIQGVLTLMSEEAKSLVIRTPGLRTPPPFQGVFRLCLQLMLSRAT